MPQWRLSSCGKDDLNQQCGKSAVASVQSLTWMGPNQLQNQQLMTAA